MHWTGVFAHCLFEKLYSIQNITGECTRIPVVRIYSTNNTRTQPEI